MNFRQKYVTIQRPLSTKRLIYSCSFNNIKVNFKQYLHFTFLELQRLLSAKMYVRLKKLKIFFNQTNRNFFNHEKFFFLAKYIFFQIPSQQFVTIIIMRYRKIDSMSPLWGRVLSDALLEQIIIALGKYGYQFTSLSMSHNEENKVWLSIFMSLLKVGFGMSKIRCKYFIL